MRPRRWLLLARLLVILAVFLAGLWVFGQAAARVPFQVNEDAYVVRSRGPRAEGPAMGRARWPGR